uniref:Prolyl 4-hydroxylase alpha subunit Fe(2+) 2OG dioxygenase domain-containing protein n=1 Tax=Eutreptiella gymnastica TaxID=73025 RepID=A0A7S4G9W3_9EUGL
MPAGPCGCTPQPVWPSDGPSRRQPLPCTETEGKRRAATQERLKPHVPHTIHQGGAEWEAVGLNECWRLAKYFPGDRFGAHVDARFIRSQDEHSMYTVNIYMNDGFKGGSTRFYKSDSTKEGPAAAVIPRTGMALIFRQPPAFDYLHDGEQLVSGLKYLFRTDVMYRRMRK